MFIRQVSSTFGPDPKVALDVAGVVQVVAPESSSRQKLRDARVLAFRIPTNCSFVVHENVELPDDLTFVKGSVEPLAGCRTVVIEFHDPVDVEAVYD